MSCVYDAPYSEKSSHHFTVKLKIILMVKNTYAGYCSPINTHICTAVLGIFQLQKIEG
jgi:hypothetical protein